MTKPKNFFRIVKNVFYSGDFVNPFVTSREAILKSSQELIRKEGCAAFSVRAVASDLGISVGTLYNYFDSKSELLYATIESIWHEIFQKSTMPKDTESTLAFMNWLVARIEYANRRYPGFISCHSSIFSDSEKPTGKNKMNGIYAQMVDRLCFVVKHDPNLRKDAFNDNFTPENFSKAFFPFLVSVALRNEYDSFTLLEIVRRTLY